MAYRQIHTQIWRDDWFQDLEPDAKLLFIYLFSNDSSNLLGLYKISLRTIAFETGLEVQRVSDLLSYFGMAGKIIYQDGYIWVVNLLRYNFNRSDKTYRHIVSELSRIPNIPVKIAYITNANTVLIPYGYRIDGVSSVTVTVTDTVTVNEEEEEATPAVKTVYQAYTREIGPLTPAIAGEIDAALKDYQTDWIVEAIRESARQNARSWKYAAAILRRWSVDGFKSVNKPSNNGARAPSTKTAQAVARLKEKYDHDET